MVFSHHDLDAVQRKGLQGSIYRIFSRVSQHVEHFWNSKWYFISLLFASSVFLITGKTVAGVLFLLMATTIFLAFCSDFLASVLPFFLMFEMAAPQYDNLSVFVPLVFAALPFFAALILHLIIWPATPKVGRSSQGLVLVSLATVLGGCDVMTYQQYTKPLSLYYSLGLGVGMLLLYLLYRSRISVRQDYNVYDRFASIFYVMGAFMVVMVALVYIWNWQTFWETRSSIDFSYRNFCATILLTTLPMPFYFALQNKKHLISAAFFGLGLLFTGSRSALLFGAVSLALCCIYMVRFHALSKKVVLGLFGVGAAFFCLVGSEWVAGRIQSGGWISINEPRWRFLICAVRDFVRHPIFGIGLGNNLHEQVFIGVEGSMVFYHNMIAQIMGSMGLLGIVAYMKLISDRIHVLWSSRTPFTVCMRLSYLGMLLISMTNPGEFCPFPNAGMMVLLFTMAELAAGEQAVPVVQLLRIPVRSSRSLAHK